MSWPLTIYRVDLEHWSHAVVASAIAAVLLTMREDARAAARLLAHYIKQDDDFARTWVTRSPRAGSVTIDIAGNR